MKIKRLLTTLTAVTMLGVGCCCPFSAAYAEDTETAVTAEAEKFDPSLILGTWEGTYTGTANSKKIERTITLNIDICDEDGSFSGYTDVTSSEGQTFAISGKYDAAAKSFSFKGTDWLKDTDGWSLSSFGGVYDPETESVSGTRDGKSDSPFSIKKTSDKYTSTSIDISKICRDWYGEYDGTDGKITVRRNIRISISEIAEDGTVKGTAIFSPSDKAAAAYALDGSYYIKGKIEPRYGRIEMQGYEWIEEPATDNFTFIELLGCVNENIIDGTTEHGIWSMESTNVLKGDLNFDNKIGIEDLVILTKYLHNVEGSGFNKTLFYYADMNDDGSVDVFDHIQFRKALLSTPE
ncbi:MAG: dockerin type I repeat-containing protein [Ruminococcus sp.]|nr:dockerin type I repeat-containing protein [Ruminococcus sp.]